MCPKGPGILLPGNYCYYSHHPCGEECFVFKDTHRPACGKRAAGIRGLREDWDGGHLWGNPPLCLGHCGVLMKALDSEADLDSPPAPHSAAV